MAVTTIPGPQRRTVAGITLIELVVAVAIVAILAAIAYPSYEEQVRKGRRAEGRAALAEVQTRLERCFTRFNAYNATGCDGVANMTSEGGWYQVSASAMTATTYTLQAVPQRTQAPDPKCGTLTITHVGVRGQTGTPPAGYKCW